MQVVAVVVFVVIVINYEVILMREKIEGRGKKARALKKKEHEIRSEFSCIEFPIFNFEVI